MATQAQIAEHLDLSERRVRDLLQELGVNHRRASIDEIRVAYIRHLREHAAGRGGDEQGSLTRARTEQALADAQMKRLTYYRELRLLVPVEEVEPVIESWAKSARVEMGYAVEKLVAYIQSQHAIEVDQSQVDAILQSAYRAIGSYPTRLSGDADTDRDALGADATSADETVAR